MDGSDDAANLLFALVQIFNDHRSRIEMLKAECASNFARAAALREAAEALRVSTKRPFSESDHAIEVTPDIPSQVNQQDYSKVPSTPVEVKTELDDFFPSQRKIGRKEVHPRALRAKASPQPPPAVAPRDATPEATPREYWSLSFR